MNTISLGNWMKYTLAGAAVAQVWGTISWMGLGWHNMDYRAFTDPTPVASALSTQTQAGPGIYVIPNMTPNVYEEEAGREWNRQAQQGPFAFMVVRPQGITPGMTKPMLMGFLCNLVIAGVLVWLLTQSSLTGFAPRVAFLSLAGGVGGLYPTVANLFWWHFPLIYSLAAMADHFVTWGLAGAVMVKLTSR